MSELQPVHKRLWLTGDKTPVLDILTEIVKHAQSPTMPVRIGTDAQKTGRYMSRVTGVVLHDDELRNGGRGFFTVMKEPKTQSLRQKLAEETWDSIELAMALVPVLPYGIEQIEIHVDANPNPKWKSNNHLQELTGS